MVHLEKSISWNRLFIAVWSIFMGTIVVGTSVVGGSLGKPSGVRSSILDLTHFGCCWLCWAGTCATVFLAQPRKTCVLGRGLLGQRTHLDMTRPWGMCSFLFEPDALQFLSIVSRQHGQATSSMSLRRCHCLCKVIVCYQRYAGLKASRGKSRQLASDKNSWTSDISATAGLVKQA